MANLALDDERAEALIAARMREFFDEVPAVLGFSFDRELADVEVELERWPGHAWSRELYDEVETLITGLALELAAEDPRGAEALRGRTFARSLH